MGMVSLYVTNLWFLIVMFSFGQQASQTCTDLEFLGVKDSEKQIKVEEMSFFNSTVYLNTLKCQGKWNKTIIKLSTYGKGSHEDICRAVLRDRSCHLTDSSSTSCLCLGNRFVQFYKQVKQQDNNIFAWRWIDFQPHQEEKQRHIALLVTPAAKTVSLTLVLTIAGSSVGLAIVIITVMVVSRHKRQRRRIRTRSPPNGMQEEIHLYTPFYPGGQGHNDNICIINCKDVPEFVGSNRQFVEREEQPSYPEQSECHDLYLHPLQTLTVI